MEVACHEDVVSQKQGAGEDCENERKVDVNRIGSFEVGNAPRRMRTGFLQEDIILKEELVDDPDGLVEDGPNASGGHSDMYAAEFVVVQEKSEFVKNEAPQMCDGMDVDIKVEKERKVKTYQCENCAWVCNSLSNLKKHKMVHTGERPHTCTECNKTFRQIHHLKDHIRTHTGERPFKCNECGSTFAQRSSLNVHKKKHTGIKPFVCKICDHATYEKEHLVIHMRTHTGEKPYQCEECGQTFSTMTRLKFHIMIHTGERRYTCEECGARFREKATLQKHRGVHLVRGPFPCKTCGKEFPRLASLSLHRRIHEQPVYPLAENRGNSLPSTDQVATNVDPAAAYTHVLKDTEQYAKKEEIVNRPCTFENIPHVTESIELSTSQSKQVYFNEVQENQLVSSETSHNVCPEQQENVILESSPLNSSFSNSETIVRTENESQGVISIADPDQVQKALESGTVWETHQENGEELLIVIPPSLTGREITLVSDVNRMHNREPTFTQTAPPGFHLSQHQAEVVQDYPPVIHEEIHEKVQQSHPHIVQEEHNSEVQTYPIVLEEEVHETNSGLLMWDDGLDPVTEVTYVIEEGAQDPIMIHQDQAHFVHESKVVTEVTRKRKKTKEFWLMDGEEKQEKVKEQDSESVRSVLVKTKIKKKKQIDKKVRVRKDYDCQQCGKSCKTSSNYNTHMRKHTGERPYFCGICGLGFKQIPHLRGHIRTHTGEKPYTCTNCNASFAQTSRLNIHKKKCNKETPVAAKKPKLEPACKVRNFYCKICDKTFIDECFKRDHMKTHMESSQYTCEICGMTYKSKSSLQKHKLVHFKDKWSCQLCGESFSSKATLHFHKIAVHKTDEASNDASGMVINVKIGEEKDFVVINPSIKNVSSDCGIDGQIKTEKIEITEADNYCVKREIIQITDAEDGTVKSEVMSAGDEESCTQISDADRSTNEDQGTDFAKPLGNADIKAEIQDLLTVDAHHSGDAGKKEGGAGKLKAIYDERGRKVFVCKVCDKAFLQSSNLLSHMRMHTGERPYKCNLCPLAFRQITHLKDHMNTHTGVRAFKCGVCQMTFSQRSAARRHIKTVHDRNADVVKIGNVYSLRNAPTDPDNQAQETNDLDQISKMKKGKTSGKVYETCEKCDRRYSTSYMKIHLRCHSGERPFSCDVCKQSFKQKSHLLSHMLRHTGEKPYVCNICHASYTQSFRLKEHMKKCMEEKISNEKGDDEQGNKVNRKKEKGKVTIDIKNEFVCRCGATFKRQVLLTSHRQKCTWNIESDHSTDVSDEEIPYNDDTDEEIEPKSRQDSNKGFTKREKEDKGLPTKVDKKLKQFTCSKCGRLFEDFLLYKDHLKEHSSSLTEVCEECGIVFRRASALAFHQKMNHNKSNDEWSYGYSEEREVHVKREVISSDEEEFEQVQHVEKVNIKTEDTRVSKIECRGDDHHQEKSELNLGKGRTGSGAKEEKIVPSGNTYARENNCLSTNPTVEQKEKRMIRRTRKPLKEHICTLCSEIFKSQIDLNKHTKICKLMESSVKVKRKKDLSEDTSCNKIVTEVECENDTKTTEMQYPCKLCGQTFTRSSKLKHHLNMWCKGMKKESKT